MKTFFFQIFTMANIGSLPHFRSSFRQAVDKRNKTMHLSTFSSAPFCHHHEVANGHKTETQAYQPPGSDPRVQVQYQAWKLMHPGNDQNCSLLGRISVKIKSRMTLLQDIASSCPPPPASTVHRYYRHSNHYVWRLTTRTRIWSTGQIQILAAPKFQAINGLI